MAETIQPTGNFLLVNPEEPEGQTRGGLYIPETHKGKPNKGTILAAGPGIISQHTGQLIPLQVRVGQRIMFVHRSGCHLIDKQLLGDNIMMPENDVVSILESKETQEQVQKEPCSDPKPEPPDWD